MTEQTNAELIAEAALISGHYEEGDATGDFIEKLADALKSADQRAELAEANLEVEEDKNAGYRAKNEQLAAVVEKVRAAIRHGSRMDAHPTRMTTGSVQDSEFWWADWHSRADAAWRRNMTEALATAPADTLRDHDAKVRAGALREAATMLDHDFQDIPAWMDAYHEGIRTNEWIDGAARMVMGGVGMIREHADRIEREAGLR